MNAVVVIGAIQILILIDKENMNIKFCLTWLINKSKKLLNNSFNSNYLFIYLVDQQDDKRLVVIYSLILILNVLLDSTFSDFFPCQHRAQQEIYE